MILNALYKIKNNNIIKLLKQIKKQNLKENFQVNH